MKYCIHMGVLGDWPSLDITRAEFDLLKEAKRSLFILVGIEEKFDMLAHNYSEFEQELLRLATEYMIWHCSDYANMHDARSLLNRRLANLLTMARLFIDQVRHEVSGLFGPDAHETDAVYQSFRTQYDSLLGYRVMEAIRNSMQHRELPIAGVMYPSVREDRKQGFKLRHQVIAHISTDHLCSDPKFKAAVAAELRQSGTDLNDITPFIRQYVEGLNRVHEELRSLTEGFLVSWRATLTDALRRYAGLLSKPVKRVVAYRLTDDDLEEERFAIFVDVIDRLAAFRAKRLPSRISEWYVTNETIE